MRLETCSRVVDVLQVGRTVPSDMPRRRAIWVLVCPAATRRSSSDRRDVSRGRGAAPLGVQVGLVQVRAEQRERARSRSEKSGPGPAEEDSRTVRPGPRAALTLPGRHR